MTIDSSTPVAVVGAGHMGTGIAQVAALAGHTVYLFDLRDGVAEGALQRIGADLAGAVQRGLMDAPQRDEVLDRVRVVDALGELEGCGLAIEAVIEKLEPKQQLLRDLEDVLDPRAILASNTSSMSITALAQGLVHPQRVLGWHFFNPAPRMRLVEVIRGLESDPALAAQLHALSLAWGKTPVDAPNAPGFIVNRVARPFYTESLRLLAEGLAPAPVIDRLLREAGGFPMGPFELIDLVGVDVNLLVGESLFAATQWDPRYAPHPLQQELVRAGHWGRKSGRGFYDYRPGNPRPQATALAPAPLAPALRVAPQPGMLAPLVERLQAAGVVVINDAGLLPETLGFDDVTIAVTDGRTATERAGGQPLILLDLARDYASARTLGATANAGQHGQLASLAAALAPAGIELLALADVAGLAVMRVVACLGNEAADLMAWTGTPAADIDIAMVLGTAYPQGPLAWCDGLGVGRMVELLAHLQTHYGDPRYRRSPRLLRAHHARQSLHT